jgi:hypothetical protein
MNAKLKWGLATVLLIALGFGIWKFQHRVSPVISKNPAVNEQYKKMKDSNDPSLVRRVVMVLKDQGAPEAMVEALQRSESKDPDMRMAMVEILCTFPFEGKAKAAIERLIRDPELKVRLRSIQYLGQRGDGGRLEFLKSYCAGTTLTQEEQDMCRFGEFRLAKTPEEQKKIFDSVVSTVTPQNLSEGMFGILVGMSPRDGRLIELLGKKIRETPSNSTPETEKFLDRVFRHLAVYAPESIQNDFQTWMNHPSRSVRAASMVMVFQYCPRNRWEVLTKVASENSDAELKRQALNAARMLGGRRAYQLAKNLNQEWGKQDSSRMPEDDMCDQKAKHENAHAMPRPSVSSPMPVKTVAPRPSKRTTKRPHSG